MLMSETLKTMDETKTENISSNSKGLQSSQTQLDNPMMYLSPSAILKRLEVDLHKYEIEKNRWTAERNEFVLQLSLLEGQIKSYASVNLELLERIKILEYALLNERAQKRYGNETVVPEIIQPEISLEKPNFLSSKRIRTSKDVIKDYLLEIGKMDELILVNKQTKSIINTKPVVGNDQEIPDKLNFDVDEAKLLEGIKNNFIKKRQRKSQDSLHTPRNANSLRPTINTSDCINFLQTSNKIVEERVGVESPIIISGKHKILNHEKNEKLNQKESDSFITAYEEDELGILAGLNEIVELTEEKINTNSRQRSETIISENQKLWAPKHHFRGHTDIVRSIDFHPEQKILASCSDDGVICLWNYSQKSALDVLPETMLRGHKSPILCVLFNNIGDILYSSDLNGNVIVWDVVGGEPVLRYENIGDSNEDKAIWSMSYNSQNRMLLTCSSQGVCKIWKPDSEIAIQRIKIINNKTINGNIQGCFYSNDPNKAIFTANNQVISYDLEYSRELFRHELNEPSDHSVFAACLNKKKNIFATGWSNKMIKIFDINSESIISSFVGHAEEVTSLSYDLSGTVLASGSSDGSVHLWSQNYNCYQDFNAHRKANYTAVTNIKFHSKWSEMSTCGSDELVKFYV